MLDAPAQIKINKIFYLSSFPFLFYICWRMSLPLVYEESVLLSLRLGHISECLLAFLFLLYQINHNFSMMQKAFKQCLLPSMLPIVCVLVYRSLSLLIRSVYLHTFWDGRRIKKHEKRVENIIRKIFRRCCFFLHFISLKTGALDWILLFSFFSVVKLKSLLFSIYIVEWRLWATRS